MCLAEIGFSQLSSSTGKSQEQFSPSSSPTPFWVHSSPVCTKRGSASYGTRTQEPFCPVTNNLKIWNKSTCSAILNQILMLSVLRGTYCTNVTFISWVQTMLPQVNFSLNSLSEEEAAVYTLCHPILHPVR